MNEPAASSRLGRLDRDLRHTGNTLAAGQGASPRNSWISSARAALVCQHATRERDEAIAAGMGKMLTQPRRKAQNGGGIGDATGTHLSASIPKEWPAKCRQPAADRGWLRRPDGQLSRQLRLRRRPRGNAHRRLGRYEFVVLAGPVAGPHSRYELTTT